MQIEVNGNWSDRKATMTLVGSDRIVASISRQFLNARELFGGQQTYQVQVGSIHQQEAEKSVADYLDRSNQE